jgi:N-acetylneuraminate lyase
VGPLVERALADGVAGLYVCGSTGEGPSLATRERKAVLDAYLDAARGRVPVVAQVGHDSLVEAADLARHAAASGVAAVSAVAPTYFKPAGVRALGDCIERIAAAAPETPFYYYHIPQRTGLTLDVVELALRSAERMPTFAGIKYTSMALEGLQTLKAFDGGRLNVLFGVDECLLSGLVFGADGAIGSTYNFAAPLFQKIVSAFERGDLASAVAAQAKAVRLVRVILKHEPMPALKAMMELIGLDCGPCRPPLDTLGVEERAALGRDLDALGLLRELRVTEG